MDERKKIFRELTDETASKIWLDGLSELGERIWVGENQISDNYSMAVSFFQSAKELEKIVLKNSGFSLFRYEYPMLFLYRHSLELYLKSNLPSNVNTHNLQELLTKFIVQIKEKYEVDISDGWFVESIKKFSIIDPVGQSFRYPKKLSGDPTISNDYVINAKYWSEKLNHISTVFLHLYMAKKNRNDK